MIFRETTLAGAFVLEPEARVDERGLFARTWCQREFEAHGLDTSVRQCNTSFNRHAGTLRGMHFQTGPFEEARLVRCTQGAIFDVIIDLRPESRTYCQHFAIELTAENRYALYVPKRFAHGFQTLVDTAEVFYQMSQFFYPDHSHGVRWNDPAFGIAWPEACPRIMSERDQSYADFRL